MRNPENLEAPNKSELKPRREAASATARALGRIAIKATKK